jgi:tRNA(Arg) A34 adenosine deaminase TadA
MSLRLAVLADVHGNLPALEAENSDETFLRRAIALARHAREHGEDPFGAVLVFDGAIVHEAHKQTMETCDPTAHPELRAISEYCRAHRRVTLEGFTLYASTEPCPMCAGAIHWSKISRVVFSVSQAMLQQLSGGTPKPPCDLIINSGRQHVEIAGPLLAEEGLAAFAGFTFARRAGREARPTG